MIKCGIKRTVQFKMIVMANAKSKSNLIFLYCAGHNNSSSPSLIGREGARKAGGGERSDKSPRSLGEGVPAKRAGERSDKSWPEQ